MYWRSWAYSAAALAAATGLILFLKPRALPSGLKVITIINRSSYIEISSEMRKYFQKRYKTSLKAHRAYRRSLISRSAEYQESIQSFNKSVNDLVSEAQVNVLSWYKLSQNYFENSVNYYDLDPDVKHYAEKVFDMDLPVSESQIMGPEKTKTILDYYQSRLREYESECPELEEYMIINAQIHDEIFRKFEIEIEVLNASWEKNKEEFGDMYEGLRNQTYYVLASTENSF
jgi:hypothetical protein